MAYDPVLQPMDLVQAIEQHRGRVEQTRENSARYAQSYATYTTTGVGEHQFDEPNLFGCTFTDQPIVAYGFSLDGSQYVEGVPLPRCVGGVREWVRDARGFYVGAYVYLAVDTLPTDQEVPEYVIDHDFTFTAVALKDLPEHLLEI